MIKWGKSKEGYVESKCGRFQISPIHWGRCNPIGYTLQDFNMFWQSSRCSPFETQKEAKMKAEKVLKEWP